MHLPEATRPHLALLSFPSLLRYWARALCEPTRCAKSLCCSDRPLGFPSCSLAMADAAGGGGAKHWRKKSRRCLFFLVPLYLASAFPTIGVRLRAAWLGGPRRLVVHAVEGELLGAAYIVDAHFLFFFLAACSLGDLGVLRSLSSLLSRERFLAVCLTQKAALTSSSPTACLMLLVSALLSLLPFVH